MKRLRFYVSGPISGLPNGNAHAFSVAKSLVHSWGHEAIVPHEIEPHRHEGPCPPSYSNLVTGGGGHTSTACFIRTDLKVLLECDAILMMKGWERSVGARLEFDVAAISGLKIFYEDGMTFPVRPTEREPSGLERGLRDAEFMRRRRTEESL